MEKIKSPIGRILIHTTLFLFAIYSIVPFFWTTPTIGQCVMFLAIGAMGAGAHFSMLQAFARAFDPSWLVHPAECKLWNRDSTSGRRERDRGRPLSPRRWTCSRPEPQWSACRRPRG